MIILKDYYLKIGKKELLNNINISFEEGKIHHILGGNGVGKSTLAKSIIEILPYKGEIIGNKEVLAIGSYTNLPKSLTVNDVLLLSKSEVYESIYNMLGLDSLNNNQIISKLSDGQNQKLKLLFFLSRKAKIIILDEFTSALDKKSMLDTYNFLKQYVSKYKVTIINITHNLTDLENLDGKYWYIKNKDIVPYEDKKSIIDDYVNLV